MNCREFRRKHVGYVDDVLPAVEMVAMRRHAASCAGCASLDVRIRRSLLVIRNLPRIQPSPDFYSKLVDRLQAAPAQPSVRSGPIVTLSMVAAAAVAAAIYFGMINGRQPVSQSGDAARLVAASQLPMTPQPITEANPVTPASAGVPLWPAMFMVGELPMHLASVELGESSVAR